MRYSGYVGGNVVVLFFVVIVLFFVSFVTRRRFGVLGLALAAGALISSVWSSDLLPIVDQIDTSMSDMMLAAVVSSALVIAPAFLLLMGGPSYKSLKGRITGAILFTSLSIALLVEPLGAVVLLEGVVGDWRTYILEYQRYIVTTLIVIAILDVWHINTSGGHAKHAKHKKSH